MKRHRLSRSRCHRRNLGGLEFPFCRIGRDKEFCQRCMLKVNSVWFETLLKNFQKLALEAFRPGTKNKSNKKVRICSQVFQRSFIQIRSKVSLFIFIKNGSNQSPHYIIQIINLKIQITVPITIESF